VPLQDSASIQEVRCDHVTGDRFQHGTELLRWRPTRRRDSAPSSNCRRSEWTVGLVAPEASEALLEIGCGPGLALALCANRADGLRLVGLDHSPVMIAQARTRLQREAPEAAWRLEEGREDALRKAGEIEEAMGAAAFVELRRELLELKPVPAVAAIGWKPAAA
jgi:SAM-dependent methyltransferase